MSLEEKRAQVVAQCKVIEHLAGVMAGLHRDLGRIYEGPSPAMNEAFYDMIGDRTAGIMEWLGDALSNMDAVTEEDGWTNPVFAKAHEMWPQPVAPLPHELASPTP